MRFISTRMHGILDYASGSLQLIAPWLLGPGLTRSERWLPTGIGVAILGYSALTAYEFGVVQAIPMPVHLGLDVVSTVLLVSASWLLGFSGKARVAYTAIGLFECAVILNSQTAPNVAPPQQDAWQVAG